MRRTFQGSSLIPGYAIFAEDHENVNLVRYRESALSVRPSFKFRRFATTVVNMPMFPKRRVDVTTRDVNGETLILDRQHEEVHQLNNTASYVWQRCNGKTSVSEIVLSMAHDFCVQPGDVEQDVAGLITQFSVLRLLEPE